LTRAGSTVDVIELTVDLTDDVNSWVVAQPMMKNNPVKTKITADSLLFIISPPDKV
jgi:hypothetical protein